MNSVRGHGAPDLPAERHERMLSWVEWLFFAVFLCVSFFHFQARNGIKEGFDAYWYLKTFEHMRVLAPLPSMRALVEGYNPPLAFWMTDVIRILARDLLLSVKIFTALSMAIGMICIRHVLYRLKILNTVPGIVFLYLAAALPVYVYLSSEIGIDSAVFLWAMVVLAIAVDLFSDAPAQMKRVSVVSHALVIGAALAAGIMTKFSGLVACAIPFLVIAALRMSRPVRLRCFFIAVASVVIAFALTGPFYYHRYYLTEKKMIAVAMEWLGGARLVEQRAKRDARPVGFLLDFLHLPTRPIHTLDRPQNRLLWSTVWFQTWKRDRFVGISGPLARFFSHSEAAMFTVFFYAGSCLFLLRVRRHDAWTSLGWILLGLSALYLIAILRFAYQYPLVEWVLFKAKYIAPGLLWVPYTAAICCDEALRRLRGNMLRYGSCAALVMAFGFLCVNYLLPVY